MSKRRIYISGPITGIKGAAKVFKQAEKELRLEGYETINPYEVNSSLPPSTTHAEYMKISFDLLDMCEYMYVLDGWQYSIGARMEVFKAMNENKKIRFQTHTETHIFESETGAHFQAMIKNDQIRQQA